MIFSKHGGSSRIRPWLIKMTAAARAKAGRAQLPPGGRRRLDEMERRDQNVFLKMAREHGPVFSGTDQGRLLICVLGNARARRLLSSHGDSLKPVTINVSSLFPGEFMRGMSGEHHKRYRGALVRALSGIDLDASESTLRGLVRDALLSYANSAPMEHRFDEYHRWSSVLSDITTGILLHLILGAERGSPLAADLADGYAKLGPNGVVWTVGEKQEAAYSRLRQILSALPEETHSTALLTLLSRGGSVDETMLGNLIYMVETGRYDLRGLFRWISMYAAYHPEWINQIAVATRDQRAVLAESFVWEVFRLNQSERLMRDVLADFTFDGFLFPKGALVRVCMWEAHKDEDTFAHPFAFNPSRFLDGQTYGEKFSPFGLDKHRCPFSNVSIRLGAIFLTELACGFKLEASGGDPVVRGPYHWEPAPDFAIKLTSKAG